MKNPSSDDNQDFEAIRQLLLGAELEKLDQLVRRLESQDQFSSEVGQILPQAMAKSAQQGEKLSEAMMPTVDEIVRMSINRDLNKFADALFPVIGPAIRKSIAETLRQMLQVMNQTLENSLSWQGLKWQLESRRTGIPLAQIVMLHSLVYQVEQVFLIHRKTGLLLHHVELDEGNNQDADMVSSMLGAIRDFVGDSFKVEEGHELGSIQVGDISIWIEQGPDVILAAAIRGDAPNSIRETMQESLELVQSQFGKQLSEFKGDTAQFQHSHDILSECMQAQYKKAPKKSSFKSNMALVVIFLGILAWPVSAIYQSILDDRLIAAQNDYIDLLEATPGYVITQVVRKDDQLTIKGLRDPLSPKPETFEELTKLESNSLSYKFEPYQSLKPEFVQQRIIKDLSPPDNVAINFDDNVISVTGFASENWISSFLARVSITAGTYRIDRSGLHSTIDISSLDAPETVQLMLDVNSGHLIARGTAYKAWLEQARERVTKIDGIRSYDDSQLVASLDLSIFNPPDTVSMSIEQGVLRVTGKASSDWIRKFSAAALSNALVQRVEWDSFVNIDEENLRRDIEGIEREAIYFEAAESFNVESTQAIERVAALAKAIISTAKKLSREVRIVIRGHSDSVGNFEDNVFLSLERADFVSQFLYNTGLNPRYFLLKGIEAPVALEKSAEERIRNRRVTFEVVIN